MAHLRLSLLGSFQLTLDGRPVAGIKSNKARALLAYLAVEGDRPHSRESLAGLLWPDWPDRSAVSNLRYTLSNLRTAIREPQAGSPFLLISRDSLQFNASSDAWVDATTFSALAGVDRTDASAIQKLEEAVDLHKGSFLDGFSVADSAPFEDWVVLTRERLARELSSALQFLAANYEQRGDFERAQAHARRQLELAPWDETGHQQVMRILALSGQRSAALAQYQACRRVLAKELNVEPGQETTRLFEQIRDGKLKPEAPSAERIEVGPSPLPRFLEHTAGEAEAPLFVAREGELKRLGRFLEQALTGKAQVAFVIGEAGSGKTALLQAFARQAEETHADLIAVSGKCSAYTGIGDPYLPFREILELLSGDVEGRGKAGAIRTETARRLWQLMPSAARILMESGPDLIDMLLSRGTLSARARIHSPGGAEWVRSLDELLESKPPADLGYPNLQQTHLFQQYGRVLQSMAQVQPLLLMVDDLQWADPGSISLLFHLGRHLAGSRVLIVGSYRPEDVAIRKDGERHPLEAVVNELGREFGDILVKMDSAEGREFVDAYLGSEPNGLGEAFRDMLWRQTRGQPLFTIELLRGLQERGDLIRDGQGLWQEGPSLDWVTLPARVEAAIRERINRMPENLRRELAVASVEGEEFTAEVVAQVRMMDVQAVLGDLSAELDRKHRLIRARSIDRIRGRSMSRFQFRHILFQKYIYAALDEVERVHLHEQVGVTLENLYDSPEAAGVIALELARHFHEAGIVDKAITYLHRAGDSAVRMSAYDEGMSHLRQALELLGKIPDSPERLRTELALQLSIIKAAMADMLGPARQAAIARARALCSLTGESEALSQVLAQQSTVHYVRAEYQEALELAEESLSLAEAAGDAALVALANWRLGFIRFALGDLLASRQHNGRVLAFYRPDVHHQVFLLLHGSDAGTSSMAYEACCLWMLGFPDQARQLGDQAFELARGQGHTFSLLDVLCFGGCMLSRLRRDAAAVKEYAQEFQQLAAGSGVLFWIEGDLYEGDALAQLGNVAEGIKSMRKWQADRAWGPVCNTSGMLAGLVEAYVISGDLENSRATLEEALSFAERTGEGHWLAELHRLRGELFQLEGNDAEAEISLLKAIEVARQQQAKSWELRAAVSLGRLWGRQGKQGQAKALLEPVYNWFTEGFDTPDLITARDLLGELGDTAV